METELNSKENIIDDINFREDGGLLFHYPPKFSWNNDILLRNSSLKWMDYHFYVHFPFCRNLCNYCTFERKRIEQNSISIFEDLLNKEMDCILQFDDFSQSNIKSVYIGGGTASLLPNNVIRNVIERFCMDFGLKKDIEVTVECEPGTKSVYDLEKIRSFGVNRISVGVQTLNDELLCNLNRIHSRSDSIDMVKNAKRAEFENIHIDLMYGLPGQNVSEWIDTIDQVIDFDVHHISIYQLIVFPYEQLHCDLKKKKIPSPPSRLDINKMRIVATEKLYRAGFKRYSVSDYSLKGFECEYVKSSWNGSNYLGIGPGGYSKNNEYLWENEVIHSLYKEKLAAKNKPIGKSVAMTPFDSFKRDIALGLCLLRVDISEIEEKTKIKFFPVFGNLVKDLRNHNLIDYKNGVLSITNEGVRFATHIMQSFANKTIN